MKKSSYKSDLERFLSKKVFLWSVIIIAVACYGYSAVNTTVSVDDTMGDYYFGNGNVMLASGRFGMTFWTRIFGFTEIMPPYTFAIEVLAVGLLIWACINFCILFERETKGRISESALNVFALLLVSYPLVNEIWEYSGANLIICVGYVCVSFVMLLIQGMIEERKINWLSAAAAGILMTLVSAGYESLVTVYIFIVTAVLFLAVVYESLDWKALFAQIGIYVGVLATGIIGRVVVSKVILVLFQLEKTTNGATSILWGTESFFAVLKKLISTMVDTYFLKAIIYFPLKEFVIAIGVMLAAAVVIAVRQKSVKIFIPAAGSIVSLFALSFLQGSVAPYRTCQVFGVFVAFCGLLLVEAVKKNKYIKGICVGSLLILSIYQTMYLSYFLGLNHLRWEDEKQVLEEIGDELIQYTREKPVVFVGNYRFSNYLTEAASVAKESEAWHTYAEAYSKVYDVPFEEVYHSNNRRIVSTNVKSVISWAMEPYWGQQHLKELFWYLGYEYEMVEDLSGFLEDYYTACEQIEEHANNGGGMDWRESYSILETDDYVIVQMR